MLDESVWTERRKKKQQQLGLQSLSKNRKVLRDSRNGNFLYA